MISYKLLPLFLIMMLFAGCHTLHAPLSKNKAYVQEIQANNTSFDPVKGEIKYTLPEDATVRIRIGLTNNGPLLHTLVDWENRIKGEHVEHWDHNDATGKISFNGRKDLMLLLSCLPADEAKRKAYHGIIKGFRKTPGVSVRFPDSTQNNDQGWPIVSGITSFRIGLDPKDKLYLSNTKYEVGIYIDFVFLMEDEEGTDPFTYKINTANINNGPHLITANVVGYDGDIGTRSVMVVVQN